MPKILSLVSVAALATLGFAAAAEAQPARIVLMRHAEKLNGYALCDLGRQRADALAKQFLGKGAAQSIFAAGEKPDAFLAVTLHPLETVTPAAQTWGLPVIDYSVVPQENDNEDDTAKEIEINTRTQEAARDVMSKHEFDGKTVVIVWEHKHIAKHKLEKAYKGEQVTLRQLLHLDAIADVPESWSDTNYDYFWIVDYAPGNSKPVGFRTVKQAFTAPFDKIPAPDWDDPEPQHMQMGCLK